MAAVRSSWNRCAASAARIRMDWLVVFVASTITVCIGVGFGRAFFPPGPHLNGRPAGPFLEGFIRWDATYYRGIATYGYVLGPGQSSIYFMPAYPMVARGVRAMTGGSIEWAMVFTSHACFMAAVAILARYTERRHARAHPTARSGLLMFIGFFPLGFFFHMGYTESQFLLICAVMMYLIESGYHPVWVAVAAATGLVTRPVGAALCIPVLLYAWHHGRARGRSMGLVAISLPVSLAGIVSLMWHFDQQFGDPLLFIGDRVELWRVNPALPLQEKALRLVFLEPVWNIFNPNSASYWKHHLSSPVDLVFGLYLADRLTFLAALGLTLWGWQRNLLNRHELAMILCLVAFPYWVNGYDNNMVSAGRFMIVIAPLYPPAGILLGRAGMVPGAVFAGCGAALMAVYAALFAQGYWLI